MDGEGTRPAIGGAILLCLGGAMIVVSVGFLTFALNEWLRVGLWPAYPLSRMLAELHIPHPQLGWARGQAALDWFLSLGACTVFFWTGAALAALGGVLIVRHDKRQRLDQASA